MPRPTQPKADPTDYAWMKKKHLRLWSTRSLDYFPEGKHIGTIKIPERVSNVAWGDNDGKTLYITASTSLYRIKLKIAGIRN